MHRRPIASSPWKRVLIAAGATFSLALALHAPLAAAEGPPPPPPEAYAACASKSAGDACVASFHGNDIDGTCRAETSDGRLFCMPSHPPPPPPEAFDACSGKKAADACTVQLGGHTMDGTCVQGPDGRLACAPPRPGDHP